LTFSFYHGSNLHTEKAKKKRETADRCYGRTYGVPRSTLVLHLKGWNVKSGSVRKPPKHKSAGSPRCLNEKDEETIAMCVKLMGKWGFGISRLELFDLVQEYVVSNAIHTRFKNGKPGEDWYLGLMKRQGLSLKKPEKLETSRMKQTDPFIVDEFYDLLSEEITNKGLQDKPGSIFNCDKTSFCHDPSNTKVISPRGQPCKRQTAGTGQTEHYCTGNCGSRWFKVSTFHRVQRQVDVGELDVKGCI